MQADGRWKVTLSTKLGAQALELHIACKGDEFTGRIDSPMGNIDIAGSITDNALHWDMKIQKPVSMKASYDIVIDGDTLSGTAKLGFLGKAKVNGVRIAAAPVSADDANASDVETAIAFVTGDSVDATYNEPYIEVDELRDEPVPHRYVHGGFKGTDARFSFYFPPTERYEGRFFHNTYPLALSADIGPLPIAFDVATGNLGFTIDSGAYYVQTNLGGADRTPLADPAMAAYRVNAAAAKFSRVVAARLYGEHRPYGYLFGGSGGSYQVIGSAENTQDVWDGFVPFVMAVPNAIPSMFTVRMHAMRILNKRNKFPAILDAISPGGSGDPYAELNEEEAAALREAELMGFPLRGWYAHPTMGSGYFNHVAPLVPMLDPTYVDDFWNEPGYLGTDPDSDIAEARFQFDTRIAKFVDNGLFKFVELEAVPEHDFADAHLVMLDGENAGQSVPIATIDGNVIGFALAADQTLIAGIRAGDRVRIDNAWTLAMQTYHRHQVPTPDMVGWNQFRDADGKPLYPQRDILIGPLSAAGTAGSIPNGDINGKMLVVECLMDVDALPWQADWYRSQVKEKRGDKLEDNFALWYIDHAQHDDPPAGKAQAHAVSFAGALQQALRDVAAWVEKGIRPSDTRYEVIDSQVHVPATAKERGGIQPVVELQANGGIRADIEVGETVTFTATIEVPPDAGSVVAVEWDFKGSGDYPVVEQIDTPQARVQLTRTYTFTERGIYFAVMRATSQRQGDGGTAYCRVKNLGMVRIWVTN